MQPMQAHSRNFPEAQASCMHKVSGRTSSRRNKHCCAQLLAYNHEGQAIAMLLHEHDTAVVDVDAQASFKFAVQDTYSASARNVPIAYLHQVHYSACFRETCKPDVNQPLEDLFLRSHAIRVNIIRHVSAFLLVWLSARSS